jgi:hypothetical protein
MKNGVVDPERTFKARLDKIDRDHVEALQRIKRNHRRMMWIIAIVLALTVAAAAFQVIRAINVH